MWTYKQQRHFRMNLPNKIPRGGGDSNMEQTGMLVGNFEFKP